MKKTLFLVAFIASFLLQAVSAQPLAMDGEVRTGKLSNGLTYYIRHNAREPKLADFYIAQRVGSILEEPRQRGLAHFLEHMAFNGTKHFRGDGKSLGIVPWCETIGVKFGTNLNAYTSVDQTVYNISSVPVKREGVLDSCLLILSDWSHDLLLTDKEIDKERGVIHEEWRTRRAGMAVQRMMEKAIPVMFQGTKYEDCMPIGSMDIVDHFPYKDLRDYYHKWYRPDLQAIIVVGDVDVNKTEAKIKKLFGAIPKPKNPAERVYYPVSDNKDMIVAIEKDTEQPIVLTSLYMKRETTPDKDKNNVGYVKGGYMGNLISYMLNSRFQDIMKQTVTPFLNASVRDGSFFVARTKDAFSLSAGLKQDSILYGLSRAVAELERARQHGFTASELERAKSIYLTAAERAYKERNDRRNNYFVKKCLNNFLESEPMLSAEENLKLIRDFTKSVTLNEVNREVKNMITDQNQVLTVYAPDKSSVKVPSADEFKQTILKAQAGTYEAYKEKVLNKNLTPSMPAPGKILSEKAGSHGTRVLTLSNGVQVYVKPTTFSADAVDMRLFGMGGSSLFPASDAPNFPFVAGIIKEGGVGNYSSSDLTKVLAGRAVRVTPSINTETQEISGTSSVKDLKALMQLTYLYFTSPRRDQQAFESVINRQISFLTNRDASPKVAYNDSISLFAYGRNPRTAPVTQASLRKVSYDKVWNIYKTLFSDASSFKMVMVGNVNLDSLRPLLEQYIATLPATRKGQTANSAEFPKIRNANETHVFYKKQATPSALVTIFHTAQLPVTAEEDLKLDILQRVLQIAYTDSVREEKGGTYGVGVSASLNKYSQPTALLKISFRTDPSRYKELIPVVYNQLEHIAKYGPEASSMEKIKKYLHKNYAQSVIDNGYWSYILYNELYQGIDYDKGYTQMLDKLTGEDIRQLAAEILKQKRRIEVTMISE